MGMGRPQLGYRAPGKASKPLSRMWIAASMPQDWDVDSVKRLLGMHFDEVQMVRQQRHRSESDFYFKAAAREDTDLVSLPVETSEGKVTHSARWAPPRPLHSSSRSDKGQFRT